MHYKLLRSVRIYLLTPTVRTLHTGTQRSQAVLSTLRRFHNPSAPAHYPFVGYTKQSALAELAATYVPFSTTSMRSPAHLAAIPSLGWHASLWWRNWWMYLAALLVTGSLGTEDDIDGVFSPHFLFPSMILFLGILVLLTYVLAIEQFLNNSVSLDKSLFYYSRSTQMDWFSIRFIGFQAVTSNF